MDLHHTKSTLLTISTPTHPPPQGALDGGLAIPHNTKRFVGFDPESKELDTEVLRDHIFGQHVAEYMGEMEEEEPEQYASHFSNYIKQGVSSDDMEDLYAKVHEAIRSNPVRPKKARKAPAEKKVWKAKRLTYEQRKANLKEKIAQLMEGEA